jgi:hypothetical protein
VVMWLVGTSTVTTRGPHGLARHDETKTGDFYSAITGDSDLATSGDFFMATDTPLRLRVIRYAKPGVCTARGTFGKAGTPCEGSS